MEQLIHPTAQIASTAILGSDVRVGPYAIIEENVHLGNDCSVGAHAVIQSFVSMGSNNLICPHAVIGGLAQDISFDPKVETYVSIGNSNVFRESVTVNRATKPNASTHIGSNCYFMNNSHVAHDCLIGNHTIFASGVAIGGHVTIGDRVFLGGGAMVHQYCRIGSLAMISGTVGVLQDVLPYTMAGDSPARHYRLNVVGLKRAGITGERYKALSTAFRRLKNRQDLDDLPNTEEINDLKKWLSSDSKRGISSFLGSV